MLNRPMIRMKLSLIRLKATYYATLAIVQDMQAEGHSKEYIDEMIDFTKVDRLAHEIASKYHFC